MKWKSAIKLNASGTRPSNAPNITVAVPLYTSRQIPKIKRNIPYTIQQTPNVW